MRDETASPTKNLADKLRTNNQHIAIVDSHPQFDEETAILIRKHLARTRDDLYVYV